MAKAETEKAFAAEGRLLAAALDARKIGPSAFSRMLEQEYGLRGGPQNVHNWRAGRGFNAKNRKLCAALLGLPSDHFEVGSPTAATSPAAKHPSLAALLSERKLRRFTLDALRALESLNQSDPGENYWRTQADMHEGIAASIEATRFRPVSGPRKSPKTNRQ
jgi:hypothetical protein